LTEFSQTPFTETNSLRQQEAVETKFSWEGVASQLSDIPSFWNS